MSRRRNVYGPVPSRRFGPSLGVDPLPPRTCCYDCVYCQQGRTRQLTATRQDFVPVEEILADVREALDRGPAPRVITLAGSGEPTLALSLDTLISRLAEISGLPVVLITNGALLHEAGVRRAAALADIVCPSLDAADEDTFRLINRPHPAISFERMVEGLRALRAETQGRYDLEVLVARGVNDSPEHLERLARLAMSIGPDAIQLNTAVRPAPDGRDLALTAEEMRGILPLFGERAEVIAGFEPSPSTAGRAAEQEILDVLERRPCTAAELAQSLGLEVDEVSRILGGLRDEGRVKPAGEDGYWNVSGTGKE